MGLEDSDVIEKRGKLPSDEILEQYASSILSPKGPRVIRHIEGQTTVNFLARQQDVECVLQNDRIFNLSHYDNLLGMVAGDVRFLLGDKNEDRDLKWQLLSKALGDSDVSAPFDLEHTEAFLKQAVDATITDIREQCERPAKKRFGLLGKVFGILRKKKGADSSFRILWDYGFMVPFRVATNYFGITPPKRFSFGLKSLIWIAGLLGAKPMSKDYGKGMLATLIWSLPVNLHVFKNFQGRDWRIRLVARMGARAYTKHIDRNIANPSNKNPDTLLNRLLQAAPTVPGLECRDKRKSAIRSILFELHGTMLILVGLGFNRSLRTIFEKGISINKFAALLAAADYDKYTVDTKYELEPLADESLAALDVEKLLNEALRFEPVAGRLYRAVSKDIRSEEHTSELQSRL